MAVIYHPFRRRMNQKENEPVLIYIVDFVLRDVDNSLNSDDNKLLR